MAIHEFMLFVQLPDRLEDPRVHTESLHRTGCNEDAIICYGVRGHIGFEFRRDAKSLPAALKRAWYQVQMAIPGVTLMEIEAVP